MDPATVFDVDVHDLERLNAEQAVDVLRELLWAEAGAVGIAKNLINVPTSINVADGGIDAEVHHAQPVGGQGIIKLGITRYQVKTGKFSLKGDASIRAILLRKAAQNKKNPTLKDLQPRVKACPWLALGAMTEIDRASSKCPFTGRSSRRLNTQTRWLTGS